MNLIDHLSLFTIPKTGRYLMVNAVFGYVDTIGEKEKETILRWKMEPIIIPTDEYEKKLYNNLLKRKYIVDKSEEINQFKNVITTLLKKQNSSP